MILFTKLPFVSEKSCLNIYFIILKIPCKHKDLGLSPRVYMFKKSMVGSACKSGFGEVETGKSRDLLASQPHLLGKFQVSYRLSKYCVALEDCLPPSTCMPTHTHVFLYTWQCKQTHNASALSSPKEFRK